MIELRLRQRGIEIKLDVLVRPYGRCNLKI